MKIVFLLFLVFFGINAYGQIQVSGPKDGTWLPPLDEDRILLIKGKVQNVASKSKVTLSLDKQRSEKNESWITTTNKDGSFSFSINQSTILPRQKTQMKLQAVDAKGKAYTSTSQSIYCCSMGDYGYYGLLDYGKSNVIEVAAPNTPIDKITVSIPKANIGENSFIMIVGEEVQGISLEKYIPLSAAIKFYVEKSKGLSDLKYTLNASPEVPRDDTTKEISKEDWNTISNQKWKTISLKKSKLVVLGQDHPGGNWVEVIPDKIVGRTVFFSQPKGNSSLSIFVIVAKAN